MLKFVDMNEQNTSGAVSLKESIIEVESWTEEHYQSQFMDFLEQQPYIMGSLMNADDGVDEMAHSWVLKAVLILKWSFQKMGWRMTTLEEEKWHGVLDEKGALYDEHQHDNGVQVEELVALSSSPKTLSELFLYVVENNVTDEESRGNILFLLDAAVEAMEMAVLQDKKELDT